ncbi:MAG: O-antigen ligase family protein [Candidatus Omnitrophica bacterium]|nr:O-antigen ligase family protein [Candidatus Omnitrophota bacterium]
MKMETLAEELIRPLAFVSTKPRRLSQGPSIALEGILYVTLAVSVFLFGGGFVEGYTSLQAMTFILLGALTLNRSAKSSWAKPKFDWVLFLLSVWILFIFVQFIPLPVAYVQVISPNLVSLWNDFYPASHEFERLTLSLGTYAMRVEVAKTCSYAGLFCAAYFLFRDKQAIKRLGLATVVIGTLLSLVGLVFYKIDPMRVYGFFYFDQGSSFTPYLNKNHFANYLVMTIPVTVAFLYVGLSRSALVMASQLRSKLLWFSSGESIRCFVLLASLALQFAAFLYPASRGAFLGLLAGMLGFSFLIVLNMKRKMAAFFLIGFFAVAIGAGLFQAKPLLSKLQSLSDHRSQDIALQFRSSNWRDTTRMFRDFPLVGFGAGGFHELFPKYKSLPEHSSVTQVRFYHAENEWLETLAEQGLIGTGLLILVGTVLGIRFFRKWPRIESKTVQWLTLGMAAGGIGMLAQSMVDFPLHLPANASLFSVYCGVLAWTGRESTPNLKFISLKKFVQIGRFLAAVLMVAAAFYLTVPFLWRQWRSEFFYLKAKDELKKINHSGALTLGPVLLAYDYLIKAKWVDAKQARIHQGLGQVYLYLGMTAEKDVNKRDAWYMKARTSFQEALEHEPFDAAYHDGFGKLYERWKKYGEAEPYFEHARLLEPQNPLYCFHLGQNQLRVGKNDLAYATLRRTLEMNHSYVEPIGTWLLESDPELTVEKLDRVIPEGVSRKKICEQFASVLKEHGFDLLASQVAQLAG